MFRICCCLFLAGPRLIYFPLYARRLKRRAIFSPPPTSIIFALSLSEPISLRYERETDPSSYTTGATFFHPSIVYLSGRTRRVSPPIYSRTSLYPFIRRRSRDSFKCVLRHLLGAPRIDIILRLKCYIGSQFTRHRTIFFFFGPDNPCYPRFSLPRRCVRG